MSMMLLDFLEDPRRFFVGSMAHGLPEASEESLVAADLLKQLEASSTITPLPYVIMELAKGGDSQQFSGH